MVSTSHPSRASIVCCVKPIRRSGGGEPKHHVPLPGRKASRPPARIRCGVGIVCRRGNSEEIREDEQARAISSERDGGRPTGVCCRRPASNQLKLLMLRALVVSVE